MFTTARARKEEVNKTWQSAEWSHCGRGKSTIGCPRVPRLFISQKVIPAGYLIEVFRILTRCTQHQQSRREDQAGLPSQHIPPSYLVVHVDQVKRSRTRLSPSQRIVNAPQPEGSRAIRSSASLPSPLEQGSTADEAIINILQAPGRVACWTPVPRDNPMPGGFILLGLCCLWPSSYFPTP